MEFASAILADIYGLETTQDGDVFDTKRAAVVSKLSRVEEALRSGPFFAGDRFSLVDAAYAPVFRYFDLFDTLVDLQVFTGLPKVHAWRASLAQRPSVRRAVTDDYLELLQQFLKRHQAHLLTLA